MFSLSPWQGVSVEEKRSGDREVWLKWLSRYSQRLYQELEPGTDVSKVIADVRVVDCWNLQVLSEICNCRK